MGFIFTPSCHGRKPKVKVNLQLRLEKLPPNEDLDSVIQRNFRIFSIKRTVRLFFYQTALKILDKIASQLAQSL